MVMKKGFQIAIDPVLELSTVQGKRGGLVAYYCKQGRW